MRTVPLITLLHRGQWLGCLLVWIAALPAYGSDWSSYLGGNERQGYVASTLSPDLHLSWTYRTQARPELAWSGPRSTPIEGHVMLHRVDFDAAMQIVSADGRAYFGSTVDHRLHCVNATTGEELWSFYSEGPIRLAPTLAHGNVYFGSDDGLVYCLQAATGELRWQMRVGPKDDRLLSRGEMISRWPVRTGVLIDGDTAYFGAGVFPHEVVYLAAVDAHSGEIKWYNDRISQQDAGRNDLSPQGYLLCNDKHLYVPSGRSLPVAFDKNTGEIVFQRKYSWRTEAGGVVGGTKALLGDGQVYAGGPHHFLAMEQTSGDVGAGYIGGRQMVLTGQRAYLMDGSKIFCVDRTEHARASQQKQEWFLRAREARSEPEKLAEAQSKMQEYAGVGILWEFASEYDDALIATDKLLIAGGPGGVLIFDRFSGEKLWEQTVEGNVKGLAATDRELFVSTDAGHIYCFRQIAVKEPGQWPKSASEAYATDELTPMYRQAAKEMLERSGQRTGFCLVVGSELGRLAYELSQQSQLTILGVEPDAEKVMQARAALEAAGVHATRVTIVHAPLENIPFSNYFANLIVSDSQLLTGRPPCPARAVSRFLKPCGGVAILGRPASDTAVADAGASQWLTDMFQQSEGTLKLTAPWYVLERGKLPGAGQWTHQYGNAGNTSFTDDRLVRDGLGVLWYGDPGPSMMINRHEAAGAPLSTNGRMFIQGTDRILVYDAYNGNFLWDRENPGAIRTGVFNNRETHNLAASDDFLFMAIGNRVEALDAATGKTVREFTTPDSSDGIERDWAYLAHDAGQLFGTATIRKELEERLRRRGLTVSSQTDSIFCFDVASGERQWSYRGDNILHNTVAIGQDHVYFIESSLTPEERQELYRRDKGELKNLTGKAAEAAEAEAKALDVRLAVALDRRTGEKLWSQPVNVTDTTDVSAGGGSLTLMVADGYILLCGANANGHYWKQFLSGEFEKRKLVVLDAATGEELWSKNANYMNRPAIIEGIIYAEPWAFVLKTGETKKRPHPLTGNDSDWRFSRPGHHCGIITATPNMMFFRSGFIGYYDLYTDSGTRHFSGQRLGCWVNAIPGNGLVMIPEASAGCVCQFSITSTVVLEPKTENKSWGILSAVGPSTPVRRLAINFGAPGDRKDNARQEWFGFPRPHTVQRLEFEFDIKPELAEGGGWYSLNPDASSLDTQGLPEWLFSSGARGLSRFELPLLGSEDPATNYQVKLFFTGLTPDQVGQVEVYFQEQLADGALQQLSSDTEGGWIVCKEFQQVAVKGSLRVDLRWPSTLPLPQLSALEVERAD